MANIFPNPDGRERIEFSEDEWKKIKSLCAIFCTGEDIASIMEVSYDTLQRRIVDAGYSSFADFFKKYSANGRSSLRSKQYQKAVTEGNPTLLIWLGKQYLDQKDIVEIDSVKPITLNYNLSEKPELEEKLIENKDDKTDG